MNCNISKETNLRNLYLPQIVIIKKKDTKIAKKKGGGAAATGI